jgi:hypothetical protein
MMVVLRNIMKECVAQLGIKTLEHGRSLNI